MRLIYLLFVSIVALLGGGIFFAFYSGLIVIQPTVKDSTNQRSSAVEKRTIRLYYWHRNDWQKEDSDTLWSANLATNTEQVIRQWLNLLDEEGISKKKISLQSALLSPSGTELYLSFDRNPLQKEGAIFEKLMWVESLLKTLRENELTFDQIHLLVHHQPINDAHLDFSQAWPNIGFIKNEN